jgi:histidyl-tRNA synthetase
VKALSLAREWWTQGLAVQVETRGANLKKALTMANRQGIKLALILGDGELEQGVVAAKNLQAGTQELWPFDEVARRMII